MVMCPTPLHNGIIYTNLVLCYPSLSPSLPLSISLYKFIETAGGNDVFDVGKNSQHVELSGHCLLNSRVSPLSRINMSTTGIFFCFIPFVNYVWIDQVAHTFDRAMYKLITFRQSVGIRCFTRLVPQQKNLKPNMGRWIIPECIALKFHSSDNTKKAVAPIYVVST